MKLHLNGITPEPRELPPSHFELREIPAADVDTYWPKMLPEIKGIIERSPDICDFIPEEIYVFLKRRVAFLHVGFLDGEYAGFGILQRKLMPFSQEPYLLSWLGAGRDEAVNLYFAELENIARRIGCKSVRHEGRLGWQRRVPGPGWRTCAIIQIKRLD